MENLSKLLPAIALQHPDSPEIREAVVFAAWKQVAGQALRRHAIPFSLEGTSLKLAVADAVWKTHLEGLASELVAKLNRKLGEKTVTFLEFLIDEERVSGSVDDENKEIETQLPEPPAELIAKAGAIADPELRKLFLKTAASYIAAQERRSNTNSE